MVVIKRLGDCFLCFIFGFIFLVVWGCETEGSCGSIHTTVAIVNFYDLDSNPQLLVFDSVYAIGSDSILYDSTHFTNSFGLPVNPFSDTTAFIFAGKSDTALIFDTLVLSYQIRQQYISRLCGVEQTYSELRIDATTFDSTFISNDSLLILNDENIRIFN